MGTMPRHYISRQTVWVVALLVLLVADMGVVQEAMAQAASGGAQRLQWPRTFTGQPDFAFTREEALQEAKARAKRENAKEPKLLTLEGLLRDDGTYDPMSIRVSESVVGVSGTVAVSGGIVPMVGLVEQLVGGHTELPTFAENADLNLLEFEEMMRRTVSESLAGWQAEMKNFPYESVLGGLVLQAVVMSPQKYVILNGERYREGDEFKVQVPVQVPDAWILAALEHRMPDEKLVGVDNFKRYQMIFENVVAEFAQQRNANAALGQKMLTLPVRLVQIYGRKVMLEAEGKAYELQVRFSY